MEHLPGLRSGEIAAKRQNAIRHETDLLARDRDLVHVIVTYLRNGVISTRRFGVSSGTWCTIKGTYVDATGLVAICSVAPRSKYPDGEILCLQTVYASEKITILSSGKGSALVRWRT